MDDLSKIFPSKNNLQVAPFLMFLPLEKVKYVATPNKNVWTANFEILAKNLFACHMSRTT